MRFFKSKCFRTIAAIVILFATLLGTAVVATRKTEAACDHEPVGMPLRYVAPTCTKAGWWEFRCKKCGTQYRKIYPATGHSLKREKVITSPTCTQDGLESCKCTECGYSCNRKIPKLGHNFVTRTVNGQKISECSRCGYRKNY